MGKGGESYNQWRKGKAGTMKHPLAHVIRNLEEVMRESRHKRGGQGTDLSADPGEELNK